MKKLASLILVLVATISFTAPAKAGFRIGPRVGLAVSSLHFNEGVFDKDNRAGFTGGLEAEIGLPLNFAVDASVLYVRRSLTTQSQNTESENVHAHRDFIEIPINLKWKLGIIGIGSIIKPYVFTGPDFAFLTSKRAITEAWRSHKVDFSWNFGFGLELISHLQISASYGLGITKLEGRVAEASAINARNNYWTITAAWLF